MSSIKAPIPNKPTIPKLSVKQPAPAAPIINKPSINNNILDKAPVPVIKGGNFDRKPLAPPSLPTLIQPEVVTQLQTKAANESSWTPFVNSAKGIWNDLIRPHLLFFIILIIIIIVIVYRYVNKPAKKENKPDVTKTDPYKYYQEMYQNYDLYLKAKQQ